MFRETKKLLLACKNSRFSALALHEVAHVTGGVTRRLETRDLQAAYLEGVTVSDPSVQSTYSLVCSVELHPRSLGVQLFVST